MPVRVLANFDAEAVWAGVPLRGKVVSRLGLLAPLLAALAPRTDELEIWAPGPVDSATARWNAIGRNATLRVGVPDRWDVAWADPHARSANDRRLVVEVQRALGIDHATVITDVAELADRRGLWVAKAPWTAAGRDRILGDGLPRADQLTYAERIIARQGALVVEPWLDRRFDVGVCAHIEGDDTASTRAANARVIAQAPHTLVCDARGGFVGIDLTPPPLSVAQRDQLDRAVAASGHALAGVGYRGPFTVDAFVWGAGALHAPCEINARHSFGHVARALGARRLGFGTPPAGATVLVESGLVTAWRA